MKKFIFLLFLSFFFIPLDTFAKTQSTLDINNIQFAGDGFTTYTQLNSKYYNGFSFSGVDYNSEVERIQASFDFSSNGFTHNSIYSMTFMIQVANMRGSPGTAPAVNVGGSSCKVTPVGNYISVGEKFTSNMQLCTSFGNNVVPCVWASEASNSLISGVQDFTIQSAPSNYAISSVFIADCDDVTINNSDTKMNILMANRKSTSTDFFYGIGNRFYYSINSNQQLIDNQQKTNENLENLNDNITNSDISETENSAGGFFNDFNDNDFGLSDIITMPLSFIQGLANNSCNSLNLPLPFVDKNATLPCMTSIYQQHFGAFLTIYQIITTGFISYWVCINVFRLVKNFKDPNNDEVEVLDL